MIDDALADLSAAGLTERFRSAELSPVAVTQAVLERIDRWQPAINAMYLVHHEAALAAARASEQRWARRAPLSPIDGVPITIKENIYTRGDPAPLGSAATDLTPKADDAPSAARVREAGAIILGKTTMPDFGMLSSGISSKHGTTRNPWRLDRNPSGSSSGAAAAVVAGFGPLHLGTDIGGSVRLPATHGGFFALKPSFGRVPVYPPFMGRVTGPMTRSVADSALLMQAIARPDARDFMSLPPHQIDFAIGAEPIAIKGLRIGLLTDMQVGMPVDAQVLSACQAAARALDSAGALIEPVGSFLTEPMLDGMAMFFESRLHTDLLTLSVEARQKIHPFIMEWSSYRAPRLDATQLMRAYNQVMAMRDAATQLATRFDFILSPTSPIPPYEAELACPGNDPHHAFPHIAFTVAWNMSEHPAASINWGYTLDGLPIGIQLVGKRFDDLGVLGLASTIESIRPAQRAWPAAPALA